MLHALALSSGKHPEQRPNRDEPHNWSRLRHAPWLIGSSRRNAKGAMDESHSKKRDWGGKSGSLVAGSEPRHALRSHSLEFRCERDWTSARPIFGRLAASSVEQHYWSAAQSHMKLRLRTAISVKTKAGDSYHFITSQLRLKLVGHPQHHKRG